MGEELMSLMISRCTMDKNREKRREQGTLQEIMKEDGRKFF